MVWGGRGFHPLFGCLLLGGPQIFLDFCKEVMNMFQGRPSLARGVQQTGDQREGWGLIHLAVQRKAPIPLLRHLCAGISVCRSVTEIDMVGMACVV